MRLHRLNSDDEWIYLDHQATTPVDRRVVDAMHPYWCDVFANPHSDTYPLALTARRAVVRAKDQIAGAIGARAEGIVFTASATEANNLAIQGVATGTRRKRPLLVTVATEHSSVLQPMRVLRSRGCETRILKVGSDGRVDLEAIRLALQDKPLLLSVMLINNETGVIQPIETIGQICRDAGVVFHSDCAQGLGRVLIDLERWKVDLATFSAHKAYGPKGIAALYVRPGLRAPITPLLTGGGQQGGLRSGTLPVALCVGFGHAADLTVREQVSDTKRLKQLTQKLWQGILAAKPDAIRIGAEAHTAPGCVSVFFPGISNDTLLDGFAGLALSTGSACNSTKTETSHVLRAMRLTATESASTLRFGLGRGTKTQHVDRAVQIIGGYFKSRLEVAAG